MSGLASGAALITGGAKRIGAAITRAIAASGRDVVIHYRGSETEAGALAAELAASGRTAHILGADLADPAAVEGLIARAEALAGPISVLVNNASHFVFDRAETVTAAAIAAHAGPNLIAPVILARDFAARIGSAHGAAEGVIVNILDQKLSNLNPDFFAYTLSKAALASATEMLAMALAPRIRVGGVSPGLTMIAARQSAENFERGRRATPLQRNSTPEDIARAVMFIIDTPSMTGVNLLVDAGEHLMRRQRDVSFNDG